MEVNPAALSKLSLIVTIVGRGSGEAVAALLRARGVLYNMILLGKGTANSDLLDYLGLGSTEKDILLSAVSAERAKELLAVISAEFDLAKIGRGIAFSVPIGSVGGERTLKYLFGTSEQKEGK